MQNTSINGASKIPQITLAFWIMKICATTLGETGGDLVSMTLNVGYALSSIILVALFLVALTAQLRSRKFRPVLYWTVILATSTAGTTMSDFMDRTLQLGYARGSALLVALLVSVLIIWRLSEGSLSVDRIVSRKGELFYWIAILFSNTLGTALGDYLADSSGLGFLGGAILISSLLALVAVGHWFTKISPVLLFWIAFILTRPFGATFGDFLTKPSTRGGLGLGTIGSSAVLFGLLAILVGYSIKSKNAVVPGPSA
ncbi:MAG TPA: hypothetical protein VK717_09195 [Opitutaceae bacterium]|jgi:uncharacterized membrane-anchored protein|nr:hypothetical protein [Opitutaceae bacterium]